MARPPSASIMETVSSISLAVREMTANLCPLARLLKGDLPANASAATRDDRYRIRKTRHFALLHRKRFISDKGM